MVGLYLGGDQDGMGRVGPRWYGPSWSVGRVGHIFGMSVSICGGRAYIRGAYSRRFAVVINKC